MLRATLRSLLSHKLRLLLSGLAVVLGVLSVSGSLVLTNTLSRSYAAMFATVYDSVDVSVTVPPKVDTGYTAVPATMPGSLVARLRTVPGVGKAVPGVSTQDGARVIGRDGKVLGTFGAPRMGINWTDDDPFVQMRSGRGPRTDGEVAINGALAKATGYAVGDRIDVLTLQPRRTFTVVGVFGYGGNRDSMGGETIVAFTLPVAQTLLLGEKDALTSVNLIAADGITQSQLRDRVVGELGSAYRVQTAAQLAADARKQLDAGLRYFNYILLGFAFVALFVGVFLILNTFSIIVAQRLRELALMRALGASRAQMVLSVQVEAFAVGLLASVTGLLLGIGTGRLLAWLYSTFLGGGVTLAPLSVPPAAIVGSLVVGVAVTMVAALLPAVRAARVPPVAAMQESSTGDAPLTRVGIAGAAVTLVGTAALLAGLFDRAGKGHALPALLVGLLLILVGAALLTPVVVRPVVAALGVAFAWWTPGRLGTRNSARNPRRTAITASALMVGISLIVGINVVLSSATKSIDHVLNTRVRVDLIVAGEATGPLRPTFAQSVLDRTRALSGVTSVIGVYTDIGIVDGAQNMIGAVSDSTAMREMFAVKAKEGTLDGLAGGQLIVDEKTAAASGHHAGDRVRIQLTKAEARTFTIIGIYTQTPTLGGWMTGLAETANFRSADPSMGLIQLAPGAPVPAIKAQISDMLRDSPEATVSDRSGFVRQQTRSFDTLLGMVQILMAMAIIIAVLGIVNTLALSVIERTRELGLLRAIGLRRSQMIGMVGVESIVISVFGALLGIVVGVGLGAATARGLRDQGFVSIALPWGQMLTYLVLGVVIGVLASVVPAIRAARLNVLNAIAYE